MNGIEDFFGTVPNLESCKASEIYPVYWREFYERLDERQGGVRFNSACRRGKDNWIPLINTGIGKVFFSAVASVYERKIEVDFTLETEKRSKDIFDKLKTYKDDMDSSFGRTLYWEESLISKKDKCRVFLRKSNVDIRDVREWRRQHDWLIRNTGKLFLAITPHLEQFGR